MPRILLIDDDALLGGPLAVYFQRYGLALDCALTPSAGLALLRQGGFDAAILDVCSISGFEPDEEGHDRRVDLIVGIGPIYTRAVVALMMMFRTELQIAGEEMTSTV